MTEYRIRKIGHSYLVLADDEEVLLCARVAIAKRVIAAAESCTGARVNREQLRSRIVDDVAQQWRRQ